MEPMVNGCLAASAAILPRATHQARVKSTRLSTPFRG
jgi:hypothetical protein